MPSGIYSWPTPFFESRAIFKREVKETNVGSKRVSIPKREAKYADISQGTDVACQVYDPVTGTKMIFDATVRNAMRVTIPKREMPQSGIQSDTPCQFCLRSKERRSPFSFDPDIENIYPFVIRKVRISGEANLQHDNPSTLKIVIPYEELSHKKPSGGDIMNIALIKIGTESTGLKKASEFVPGRKRSVFRAQLTRVHEKSFSFSVPSVRRRLKGYNLGDELQLIGRFA